MYISFDYLCLNENCKEIESRMVKKEEMDKQVHHCNGNPNSVPYFMKKLPAGTRTTFRFADTKLK